MMNKMYITMLLGILLILPMVSAFDFDNVVKPIGDIRAGITLDNQLVEYNPLWETYAPIKIDNAFGLPLIGDVLVEGTINKNTETCGSNCESEFTICNYQDTPAIESVEFYKIDDEGNRELTNIKSYQWYVKTGEEEIEVPDYEIQCSDIPSDRVEGETTHSCQNVQIGTHTEAKPIWEEYNYENKQGCFDYKLTGKKNSEDTIDFVPKIAGKEITEWAVWGSTGDLFKNPSIIYKLEEANGGVIDYQPTPNNSSGTASGIKTQVTGISGYGYFFNRSSYSNLTLSGTPAELKGRASISLWFNQTTNVTNSYVMETAGDNAGARYVKTSGGTNGQAVCGGREDGGADLNIASTGSLNKSQWYNIVCFWEEGNPGRIDMWINGVYQATVNCVGACNWNPVNNGFVIGNWYAGTNGFNGTLDEFYMFNKSLTMNNSWASLLYDNGAGTFYPSSNVILNSPVDYYNSSSSSVTFNVTASATSGLTNISYYDNSTGTFSRRATNIVTGATNTTTFTRTLSDGTYLWGAQSCGIDNSCSFSLNRTISVDTVSPVISILYPTGSISGVTNGQSLTLNFSVTHPAGPLGTCWKDYNGVNTTMSCTANSSFTYVTGINTIKVWANDTAGNIGGATSTFSSAFVINNVIYSSTAYETQIENIDLNLTYNSSAGAVTSILNYDGINYSSINIGSGNNGYFRATVAIPLITSSSNKTFFWYLNNAPQVSYNQTVSPLTLIICNSTDNIQAINFSYYDESSLILVNGTTNATTIKSDFKYWLGDGSVKKSYNYQNLAGSTNSYAFCVSPGNVPNINYNLILEYGASGYIDNEYDISNGNLSNVTDYVSLYLLPSSLGTKFTHTVREGISAVPNAVVSIEKFFVGLGNYTQIGIRTTDSTGRFTQYLELDKRYRYTVTENGNIKSPIEISAICAVSPCEITLQIEGNTTQIMDEILAYMAQNVNYTLTYNTTTKMVNLNFQDLLGTAHYWRLYVYKPYFGNESEDIICNQTSYTVAGSMSCNYTGYQGTIIAKVYISRSPEKLVQFIDFLNDEVGPALGVTGLLASIIILLVIIFAGARNPTNAMIMIPFGLIILKFLAFMPLGWGTVVAITVICWIIAAKMKT